MEKVTSIKYVVYQLNTVMNSIEHLALSKVEFKGLLYNSFDTEQEAINALIENDMAYEEYFILKRVYIH